MTWASNQYLVIQRPFLWQRFADAMMESKYREEYWVKNMRHALNVLLTLKVLIVALILSESVLENSILPAGDWAPDGVCQYPTSRIERRFLLVLCSVAIVPNLILRQTWTLWLRYWNLANSLFGTILMLMSVFFVLNNVYPFSPSCQCIRAGTPVDGLEDCPTVDPRDMKERSCFPQGYLAWEIRRSEIDCSLFGATSNQIQIIFLLFLPRLIPVFKYSHLSWLYFLPWLTVAIALPLVIGIEEHSTTSMYVQRAIFSFCWLFIANAISVNHKFMLEKSQRKQFSSAVQDQSVLLRLFDILRFMLPTHILHRQLADPNGIIADHVDFCSILFCCIDDFDVHVKRLKPADLLKFLNGHFTSFDELCSEYEVSKIETIGEVYVCAVGLTPQDLFRQSKVGHSVNLERLLHVGQEMLTLQSKEVTFKIGLHTGPIVAGVVGTKLPRYRLFGDTINTAARMQQKGFPGEVNFSSDTLQFLPTCFDYSWKGTVEMKGKGQVHVNVLGKLAPALTPNQRVTINTHRATKIISRGIVNHLVEGPGNRMSDLARALQPFLPSLVQDMDEGRGSFEAAVHNAKQTSGILRTVESTLSADPCSKSRVTFQSQASAAQCSRNTERTETAGSVVEMEVRPGSSVQVDNNANNALAIPLISKDTGSTERNVFEDLSAMEDDTFRDVITAVVKSEPNVQYKYRQRNCCPAPNTWATLGKRMRFADNDRESEFQRWYHERFIVRKIDKRLQMHVIGLSVVTTLEGAWSIAFPLTSPHQMWGHHRLAMFLVFRALCISLATVWWFLSYKPWILQHPLHVQRWLTLTLCIIAILLFLSTDAIHPYYPGVHYQQKYESRLTDGDLPYESVRTASYFLQFSVITTQYRLLFRHSMLFVPLAFVIAAFSTIQCFCVYIYIVSKAAFFCGALLGAFVAHSLEHMSRKRFARDQSRELTRLRVEGTLKTLMPPMVVEEMRRTRSMTTVRPRDRSSIRRSTSDGPFDAIQSSTSSPFFTVPTISHEYEAVTILQADLVGFTKLAAMKTPDEVLRIVGDLFAIFDDLTEQHEVYKLETVGDAYIAVQGGPPLTIGNDPMALLRLSMAMVDAISEWAAEADQAEDEALASINCRVGVHHGPVVGGIVGQDMQRYHLFGKTMHVIDLLEATSQPGKVHVSLACKTAATAESSDKLLYVFEKRKIQHLSTSKGDTVNFSDVGGKTYFLSRQPDGAAEDIPSAGTES